MALSENLRPGTHPDSEHRGYTLYSNLNVLSFNLPATCFDLLTMSLIFRYSKIFFPKFCTILDMSMDKALVVVCNIIILITAGRCENIELGYGDIRKTAVLAKNGLNVSDPLIQESYDVIWPVAKEINDAEQFVFSLFGKNTEIRVKKSSEHKKEQRNLEDECHHEGVWNSCEERGCYNGRALLNTCSKGIDALLETYDVDHPIKIFPSKQPPILSSSKTMGPHVAQRTCVNNLKFPAAIPTVRRHLLHQCTRRQALDRSKRHLPQAFHHDKYSMMWDDTHQTWPGKTDLWDPPIGLLYEPRWIPKVAIAARDPSKYYSSIVVQVGVFVDRHLVAKLLDQRAKPRGYMNSAFAVRLIFDAVSRLFDDHIFWGRRVAVNLTEIIFQERPDFGNVMFDADGYLNGFCNMIVPKVRGEFSEYKQFPDVWMALTGGRLSTSRDGVEREINGLSFISSACTQSWKCALARFNGQPNDIYKQVSNIAQMIGYQLGMLNDQSHDATNSGQKCADERHVMSYSNEHDRKRWSTCSISDFNDFMDRGRDEPSCLAKTLTDDFKRCGGTCLKTIPQQSYFEEDPPPVYDLGI